MLREGGQKQTPNKHCLSSGISNSDNKNLLENTRDICGQLKITKIRVSAMAEFQLSVESTYHNIDAFIKIVSQPIPKELFREVFGDRKDWETDPYAKYPYYSMYESSGFNGIILFRRMHNDFDPNSVNDKERLFEVLRRKADIRFIYNAAMDFAKFIGRPSSNNWTKEFSEFILYAENGGFRLPKDILPALETYLSHCNVENTKNDF